MAPMVEASQDEGFQFLVRFRDACLAGERRFTAPGEVLLGAYEGQDLKGICGLSHDPYGTEPGAGRIRHLYVLPAWRGKGIGRLLVEAIEERARETFRALVLRTDTAEAARFYVAMGYEATAPEVTTATHRRSLEG